jgi:hypothetical protein
VVITRTGQPPEEVAEVAEVEETAAEESVVEIH